MKKAVRTALKKTQRFRNKILSERKLLLNIVRGKQTNISKSKSSRMSKANKDYERDILRTRRLITNNTCNKRQTSSWPKYLQNNANVVSNSNRSRTCIVQFTDLLSPRCSTIPNTSTPKLRMTSHQGNHKKRHINNPYNELPKFNIISREKSLGDDDVVCLDSSSPDNFVTSVKSDIPFITINNTYNVANSNRSITQNASGSVPDLSKFSILVTNLDCNAPEQTKISEDNQNDSIIFIDSDKVVSECTNETPDQKNDLNATVITVEDETDNDECAIVSPLPFRRLKISKEKGKKSIYKKKEKIGRVNHIPSTAISTKKLITLVAPIVQPPLVTTISSKGKPCSSSSTNMPDVIENSLNKINSNVYSSESIAKNGLREIIIDGSNVALRHSNGTVFSVEGLQIVIDYFVKRGHKVRAFVPQFRLIPGRCSNPELLRELVKDKYVILTPSRSVTGRRITPYDDRFIIQYASLCEGIVVSSDCYRDLINENPEWRNTIENRLLMPTWIDNVLMFPEDPLGRFGPSLTEFLKFPVQ